MTQRLLYKKTAEAYLVVCLLLCLVTPYCVAQMPVEKRILTGRFQQAFFTGGSFIENAGQYGKTLPGYENMGIIQYAYEGFGMPVLFTHSGMVHLQRKIEKISQREEERLEKEGRSEEEIEMKKVVTNKVVTMEWMGANTSAEIVKEDRTSDYHTYGTLQAKAYGYKKITYKNLYPGIDIVYTFNQNKKEGFEYSLLIKPGADLSLVKMKYGGDVKSVRQDEHGNLVIRSGLEDLRITLPVSYYGDEVLDKNAGNITAAYKIFNNEISFFLPKGYDHTKAFVIDPFVNATGNLTGINAGKAKDVDYDYGGNVYVTGGGDGSAHKLAKYNAAGVLQWTFNGTLTIPSWNFGTYWGGWMVEKPTGNIYLGQGFNPATGFQVIRISTTGLYDNFITTANATFREAWKMLWSCNNGSPQILVAGGGTNSNINFGVFVPPSATITPLNVTGIPYTGADGWAQDIVDFIIDPSSNEMYTIYGSLIGHPSLTNKIYKNTFPYSAASVAWNVPSGFISVQEIANRPYLVGGPIDNSANIFAINASYLYYWDGKNLKAFNKATGAGVGAPLVTANAKLMQGGIVADACDNIFVGDGNGVIKVYKFNGAFFDDAAAPDIVIPGFTGKAVYDLAYDESKKLLYASGDGFVASFDISAYCLTTQYTLNAVSDCINDSVTVTVSPTPPAGSTITYTLSAGAVQTATNTTGIFTGLTPNITYTVVATINLSCSGLQATTAFVVSGPTITTSQTNTTCGLSVATITAAGSATTGPYTYSIDGRTFQASGTFTGLAAGVYTITVKDAGGCKNIKVVTLLNTNGPSLSFTSTNADCGSNNGTVSANANGGTTPYQYSINSTTFQSGNFFTGLNSGNYTLTVKDADGCSNAKVVNITSSPGLQVNAIPAAATCGNNNGTITAFASAGTGALQYSINGNNFQVSNVFLNLTPAAYTVTVKDANGCIKTTPVIIGNSPAPTVTAISTSATCNNFNGTITVTGSGGIAPLQYSMNAGFFQTGNSFAGLAPGTYTVTVKDATSCTNTASVTVGSTNTPTVTATSIPSACIGNNGSITAVASSGAGGYQYSINGATFQPSGSFTALAAGNYVVYVKDANGCIGTVSIVVGTSAGPAISVLFKPVTCNVNDGMLAVTVLTGTGPFQFSVDGTIYQGGNTFTGLSQNIYTVYVKDANGCIKTTTVTISNSSGLTLAASSITASCNSINGSITATANGGVNPLQYSINGTVYQASNIFSGVAAGNYTVYVKDANGCIVTKAVTVASVTGPSLNIAPVINATCASASGVIAATTNGGVAPLTYSLDGGAFQAAGTFVNVAAGTHAITVKDATGCTASQSSITINNSGGTGTPPADVIFTIRDVLACTGEGRIKNIKGVPGGGGNKYTFSLDGGLFTTANQFKPVSVGTHTITAQDQNGCTVTKVAIIGNGVAATATATSTGAPCNTNAGTITITGVGANTPYHASIDGGITWITFFPPGINSQTFPNLLPGTYSIIIADDADFVAGPPDVAGACLTTIFVAVPSTGGPSISTTQVNPTCTLANGSITVIGGGVLPLTYNINGGTYFSSGVFNNLAPGSYAVTVKDGNGCINGLNVTTANTSVPTLIADVKPTSCNISNGSITANATGGVAPLQYSINGTTFQASNIFTGLAAGSYTLYVSDVNNCYGTLPVTINNTVLPKATAYTIAATCNNNDGSLVAGGSSGIVPYTFSISGTVYQSSSTFSNLAAGLYTVYIKDNVGCITSSGVPVGNIGAPAFTNTFTPSTCGNANGTITIAATGGAIPYQYSSDGIVFQTGNTLTGLLPAVYNVAVKEVNGCVATKQIVVANTSSPQTLTAAITNAACGVSNGTITATASGGTAPLQYSIDGTTYQTGITFSIVAAGSYTLYVKDVNGCIKTLAVSVANLTGPLVTATASPASCGLNDGTVTAIVSGGTGVISYSKDGVNLQAGNIFTGLATGPYNITVKDLRGCTSTTNISVNSFSGSLIIPTFSAVVPVCAGSVLPPLPTTSLNGINGTWLPALNNTATTTYLFTPAAGQCASTASLIIIVNPNGLPTFNPVAAICSGAVLLPLPTTSLNGITGKWAPALDNTTTATYTFTPTAGLCAAPVTLTIIVSAKPAATIIYHN